MELANGRRVRFMQRDAAGRVTVCVDEKSGAPVVLARRNKVFLSGKPEVLGQALNVALGKTTR